MENGQLYEGEYMDIKSDNGDRMGIHIIGYDGATIAPEQKSRNFGNFIVDQQSEQSKICVFV